MSRVALGALALAVGLTACDRWNPCPPGQKVQRSRSIQGQVAWCKTSDGTQARWIEFQPGDTEQPRMVCDYLGGKAHGPFHGYHKNGKRWIDGRYENGFKAGDWELWDDAGNNKASGEYREGTLVAGAPVGAPARCEAETP